MNPKLYTGNFVMKSYHGLTYEKKVEVLYEALKYMQAYNVRSIRDCIILAMDYEVHSEGDDTYTKGGEA